MKQILIQESLKQVFWQKCAVGTFFFIGGFGAASWATLVPFLKARMAVGEDVLGMMLLCIGTGSLITMPFSGVMVRWFGCRRILMVGSLFYGLLLIVLCTVSNFWLCVVAMLLFGGVMGTIDVVVNIAAVVLEKATGQRLMSGLHGMWSMGGFVGAGAFGLLLKSGSTAFFATLCTTVVIAFLAFSFARFIFEESGGIEGSSTFAVPHGVVVFIGIVAMVSFLVEGAIMDWSGIFLTSVRGLDMSFAGAGFSIFSVAMLTMRLGGDYLVKCFGGKRVVCIGSLLGAIGFLFVIFAEWVPLEFGGFFLIGIGMGNIVPVFFSLAGRQQVMPINTAVSAVSTLGYLGILMGPALIGFIAHQTNLVFSFGLLASLMLVLGGMAIYVYRVLDEKN
jgi:predicted MFS family arabinose efflux permease